MGRASGHALAEPDRQGSLASAVAEALRRERDLLSAVLDTAGALVVVLDPQGRIVRFNRACETATGYSFEEVKGKTLWDLLLLPEEAEPVRAVFDRLRAGQFPNEHENHWLTKAGERRLIAWSNTALLDARGAVEYVIGAGLDVTERKQAEAHRASALRALRQAQNELEMQVAARTAELRETNRILEEAIAERDRALKATRASEEHLRSLMESAQHYAIYRIALDATHPYLARVVLASPSLEELLRPSDLYDLATWFANIHPDDLSRCVEANRRSLETGIPFDEQFRVFKRERGDWDWVHDRSMPVFDDTGKLTHFNGLLVDITEQKRIERTLLATAEFEDAIASISRSFINLMPKEVDEGIRRALETIGAAYHVERAYVLQFSGDRSRMTCTHEWCAQGIEPQMDKLKDLPIDHFRWTVAQIIRSQVVQVRSGSDLPPEAGAERAEFGALGLEARLVIPMVYQGVPVGLVGFDTTRVRQWTWQSLKLQVIGDIIVNALEHRRAQEIQAGQRQFLELLATGGGFSETLHTLVRLIEAQWPGMLGLILLLDEDGRHLHIGASVSLPQDYVQSIEGLEIGPMVGSCGTACYRHERVIVVDTATDPRWEGLRDLALRYNLRACWSEPVLDADGRVLGTFAMYYRQPRAPTEAELRAIEMGAHLVGVAIEHNRAQQALRESEEKFRGIIEHANVGLAIVQQSRFQFMNPHYAAMLGYSVEEMLGTEYMQYCTPEERDRIVDLHTRRVRGEAVPTRYETSLLHKNGSYVYAEVSVGMIPYGGQQATFVFLRDITEEIRAQQALQEAYRTLEQRVEERTSELAALNSIAAVVSGSLDLHEIMSAALDRICEVLGMEFGTAYGLVGGARRAADGAGQDAGAAGSRGAGPDGAAEHLVLLACRGLSARYAESVGEFRLPGALEALSQGGQPFVWLAEETALADQVRQVLEREECRQVVTLPLVAKGRLVGAINLGARRPREFTPEQLALLASVGHQIGVAMDNARLYAAEQSRRGEAERRRRVADGMREILATLNSRRPLGEILNFIAAQASRLLGSDATALCRLDTQAQILTIQASYGLSAEFTQYMVFQIGLMSIVGEAVLTRKPTTTSNLSERLSRVDVAPELVELFGRFVTLYRSVLVVPLFQEEEIYGAMALYYQAEREFSEEEVDLAVAFAEQTALAIKNARLREQAEQAAALEERGRLARELHDSVTQSLYSVTMYTEAAARLLPPGHEAAAQHLRDARDTAQEALREMRLLIYQLRPPALESGGLAVALQVRLDAVERRGGIQAELTVEGEDRLPPAVQAELHQIAQEALNNALKHAHARRVQVRLHLCEDATRLVVQDDGVGFEPAAAEVGGGLGLPGMRERAHRIGGRLEIESAPGQGTSVLVVVPSGGGK